MFWASVLSVTVFLSSEKKALKKKRIGHFSHVTQTRWWMMYCSHGGCDAFTETHYSDVHVFGRFSVKSNFWNMSENAV